MWEFRGQQRPVFALETGPGQESVWDYPRPPALVPDPRRVTVRYRDQLIADTIAALRILETASPPTFYLPPEDIRHEWLEPSRHHTDCEWKGTATYWSFVHGKLRGEDIGWSYPAPSASFASIAGYFSFYPSRAECYVDDERVRPQLGGFYGGWVTDEIVGPYKGEPGTGGW